MSDRSDGLNYASSALKMPPGSQAERSLSLKPNPVIKEMRIGEESAVSQMN